MKRFSAAGFAAYWALVAGLIFVTGSSVFAATCAKAPPASYYDNSGYPDALAGGVRMIPIKTADGTFHVWTRRIGNNPRIKVLLAGGPGMSHAYLEAFNSWFPCAGIQFYYYDQLGTGASDHPKDTKLWTLSRYVDEVEQVRKALGLNKNNFYLYGHSWGGMLALQYVLKYQQHLKGLIISNMMASAPAYNAYAHNVLMPQMNPKVLAEILKLEKEGKTDDPRYMNLLMANYYTKHILRMPPDQWPEPVMQALNGVNETIYTLMQGPSEMGLNGRLEHWDVSKQLKDITVPTLMIGAHYGTMNPKYMKWMAGQVQHGRFLHCPRGSHLCMYYEQKLYMGGIIKFIENVNTGRIPEKPNVH